MREWEREREKERASERERGIRAGMKCAYLTRTLDSAHLFEHSPQPLSLLLLVPRLAFAPRGLGEEDKHSVAHANSIITHTPPFPPDLEREGTGVKYKAK